ncbi:hypothetical protein [Pseudomonas serbica]|jgi:hypothetical protein|uniref:hypothetical protein n=1 Tax=Pseudomonas serbica TaxID=2965074 RepID=UPI00237ABD55|nr:hypothetical protein [Pseudomonas serbica]
MKTITTDMATALKHLVDTIDLNAEQIKDENWIGAVCDARDALPENTVEALTNQGKGRVDAFALAADSASILELAADCVERGLMNEALLHLGMLSVKLHDLAAKVKPSGPKN